MTKRMTNNRKRRLYVSPLQKATKASAAEWERVAKLHPVKRDSGRLSPFYIYHQMTDDSEFYRLTEAEQVEVLEKAVRIAARGAWRGIFAKKRGGTRFIGWNEKKREFPEERTTGGRRGVFVEAYNGYAAVMTDRGAFIPEKVTEAAGDLWGLVCDYGSTEELPLADRGGNMLPFGKALVAGASRINKRLYGDDRRRETALMQANDDGDDVVCIADVHVNGRIRSVEDDVIERLTAEERIAERRRIGYAVGTEDAKRDAQAYRDVTDELLKGNKNAAGIARRLGIDERTARRIKERILDAWDYRMPRD